MPRPPARFNSSEKGLNGITPVKPQAHAVDPSPAPNILEPRETDEGAAQPFRVRSDQCKGPGRRGVGELLNRRGDPAPGVSTVVIAIRRELVGACGALFKRFLAVALQHQGGGAPDIDLGYHTGESALAGTFNTHNCIRCERPACQGGGMAAILTAEDVVRRHCRRVCLCRRARRCRHSTGAGSRNRAAVWGAISPAAAAQTHAAIETGTFFVIRLRFLELFGQLPALSF
jgi:hypothetical protein